MDTIILTNSADIDKLFAWRDKNKELVRNVQYCLHNGIIKLPNNSQLTFKYNKETSIVKYWYRVNNILVLSFTIKAVNGKGVMQHMGNHMDVGNHNQLIESLISVHFSALSYMENYIQYVEVKTVKERTNNSKANSKRSKGKTKMIKVIYLRAEEAQEKANRERKEYNKPMMPFGVRGHYRTLKNGNRIWIKQYVKNNKGNENIKGKEYKM